MDLLYLISHYCYNVSIALQIEQDDAVRYVTASIESTQKDQTAGADDRLAAQKAVNATLTVMFKLPGESGETS